MPGFGASMGMVETFLRETNEVLRERDGERLQDFLVIEPPFKPIYENLIAEVRQSYPQDDEGKDRKRLEERIQGFMTECEEIPSENGVVGSWSAMVQFLAEWLAFLRDLNVENLLDTYLRLSELLKKATNALGHSTKGIIILPTVIAYAKVFARLAIGLDKKPELIAHLVISTSEDGSQETLPEKAAEVLRKAFVSCLNDRNTTPTGIRDGKPDGKKVAIYKLANICLKVLFQCDKKESGEYIFANISNSSPPLSIYPASERVTYLYYLGRFHFMANHFYPAQIALQRAYDECPIHASCLKQRRLIVIYLIAANLILGRFPTPSLYGRPEAHGLRERFHPITRAIAKGDLESFRRLMDWKTEHAPWFLHYRIFEQIQNRCEVYVWRSIFRKVFLLSGDQGDTNRRAAPTIDLRKVLAAFHYFEKRAMMNEALAQQDAGPGRRHISFLFMDTTPPASAGYVDPDFDGLDIKPVVRFQDIIEMEAIASSLVLQGFLNGFISHSRQKFAITGAKKKGGALVAGFPRVWEVVRQKAQGQEDECPGWKRDGGAVGLGGTVIRLSGARGVGVGEW
ncbi:hypothetical protein K469DRAFT_698615 [Zopfia rhizophila CBS 207.26]|uniref:PCI domain-containing protein n=1 Tax=Zopfia rhizophila CBS 207.26 TaxID=1314779 RepID=A0A6A6EVK7_9PEZI|nr:hypothetical protein K469DRAFT_698615 [Zopfia rhizophila CBS 207.26]